MNLLSHRFNDKVVFKKYRDFKKLQGSLKVTIPKSIIENALRSIHRNKKNILDYQVMMKRPNGDQ